MIRKALALSLLIFGLLATSALADAPDPIPSATHLVSSVVNPDGSLTVTIAGQWQWPTHNSNCNQDRSGVGYAIAWNDPADPGNFVGNNQLSTTVGTTNTTAPAPWFNVNLHDGNLAHAAMPQQVPGGNDPGTGPNITYTVAANGGIPTQTDANNWITGCGTYAPGTFVDKNGQTHNQSFNTGTWGPISHTYAASDKGAVQVCPIMYDPHQGPSGVANGQPNQITAGGQHANNDNSIQSNGDTPLGNGCFSTTFARLATSSSPTTTVGSNISDVATVTGNSPTGTVNFNVYGPGDTTCSSPLNTSPLTATLTSVNSTTSTATSPTFQATKVGTYRWVATYSGDSHNQAMNPSSCTDANEQTVVNAATPMLITQASASSAVVNSTISDTATLSGGANPQGTMTWQLVTASNCTAVAGMSPLTATVNGNGSYKSPTTAAPAATGSYVWTATYTSSDGNNTNVGPVGCNPLESTEQVTVTPATPGIATNAESTATLPASITDQATLSNGDMPTGTITFTLYSDSKCTQQVGSPVTATVNSGNGNYTSPGISVTNAGTYSWIASYSGDANNSAVSGKCGDANESTTVNKAGPAISTQAQASATIGAAVTDQATLTGGNNPTGTITWTLYSDSACTQQAGQVMATVNNGNGTYTSPTITPNTAGTYHWIASYSGDTNNAAVSGKCSDANETTTINQVGPAISTVATPTATLPASITDLAMLSGGDNPTGKITWTLYSDSACTQQVGSPVTANVNNGNNTYTSPAIAVTTPGTYHWIASYSGDTNNSGVSGHCTDANETTTVSKAGPSISTVAQASATIGASVTDQAILTNGNSPTGSITWTLYSDGGCTQQVGQVMATVNNGNGTYTSPSIAPTKAGTYHWIAKYSGDTNNSAVSGNCSDPNETTTIGQAAPTIATTPQPNQAQVGTAVADQATLSGGNSPTGMITWNLYSDSACTNSIGSVSATVNGNGNYTSPTLTPNTIGTYHWIANYGGDTNNASATGSCSDPSEVLTVGSTPAFTLGKTQMIGGSGQPFTTSTLTGLQGQTVEYQITATNTGNVPLTFGPLTDTPCDAGTIAGGPGNTPLAPTAKVTWTCSHVLTANDQLVGSFTNVASTTGTPPAGQGSPVPETSNQVVVLVPTPGLTIVKTQRDATTNAGGAFTGSTITATVGDTIQYQITVSNPSTVPLKLNFSDPNCSGLTGPSGGNIDSAGDLEGGSSTQFNCSHVLVAGDAPAYTNTATVTGTPPSGPTVGPFNSSVVANVSPPPSPNMTTVKEQKLSTDPDTSFTTAPITAQVGQTVVYRIVISNTGNEPLTLSPLSDQKCDANTITGPTGSLPNGQLQPGTNVYFQCTHVVAAGDVPSITNVAMETGTPPGGTPITETASVVANVPQQQVAACVASTATIKVTKNTKKSFVVQVGGSNITKVVFRLDGKTIKTLTAPNAKAGKYQVTVDPSKKSFGTHHLVAQVSESCGPAQTKAAAFNRKAPTKKITPKFTG